MKIWRSIPLGFCLALPGGVAYAQTPPPITSSGLNTQVSAPVSLLGGAVQHNITGGTRPGGGANLFHSFGEFGVPTNNIANFLNDAALPTTNILSRVTGGNPSNIFGTIQTEGFGNANLFLMNPAGIVFGPNASLNVGGGTHFTTADYLRLADGVQFTAMPSVQDVLLTIAPIAAFGFLESNPASILVDRSKLSVADGQTLSLVGGDMTIRGSLKAPGGKIAIASVASSGEAPITGSGSVELFDGVGQSLFPTLGDIVVKPGSQVEAGGDPAGTIYIRGGNLMVAGGRVDANALNAPAAPIGLDVRVSEDAVFLGGSFGESFVGTRSEGSGNAGAVVIKAKNLFMKGNESGPMILGSSTFGSGNGGDVTVMASESVTVEGSYTQLGAGTEGGSGSGQNGDVLVEAPLVNVQGGGIFNRAIGTGQAGRLTIKGEDVIVTSRPEIDLFSIGRVDTQTFGPGTAGDLTISATHSVLVENAALILADALGTQPDAANGGNILIEAPTINIIQGGQVNTSTIGPGQGGSITLRASESITVSRIGQILAETRGTDVNAGNGGQVHLEGPVVNITEGSLIRTRSFGPGKAGDVVVIGSDRVNVSGIGKLFVSTGPPPLYAEGEKRVWSEGNPFPDLVKFPDGTTITDGATITVELYPPEILSGSEGTGSGGNIHIHTPDLLLRDQTIINAENTADGKAGNVLLAVGKLLADGGTSISTSSTGAGRAGSIITRGIGGAGTLPSEVTMESSFVSTSASGTGAGGEILIGTTGANPLILTNTTISASANDVPQGHPTDQGLANLTLLGQSITKTGGRLIAETTGTRRGGDIIIRANQSTRLTNAEVSVQSTGSANAGKVLIETGRIVQVRKTHVSADAAQASGGSIKLTANDTIHLVDSTIESTVKGNATTVAGNIELDPDFIILQNSHILAKATDGQGGNITLIGNKGVLVDSQSSLEVTSQRGISGTVNIESPIQVLSGTIAPLPDQPVNVARLYAARCVAGEGGQFSTFVDSKSDSVAPTPGTFLASPFLPQVISSPAGALGHADTPSGVSGIDQTPPIQLAAYSPPVLFGQGDGMASACP